LNFETIQESNPSEKVLQVTLNRPRQFNALNRQMMLELKSAVQEFTERPEQECLILTGAGRAFCFGADFAEFQNRTALPDLLDLFQGLILDLYDCQKTTIACVNGFATGAGLDLALACDFRVAVEKTKLGEAYISMGLVSDGGGSFLLPRLIGPARAMEMFLTGDAVVAEEAMAMGFVNQVYPQSDLMAGAIEFANRLVSKPAMARSQLKKLLKTPASNLRDALRNERAAQLLCFEDPDHLRLAEEFNAKAQRRKENK